MAGDFLGSDEKMRDWRFGQTSRQWMSSLFQKLQVFLMDFAQEVVDNFEADISVIL